MIIESLISNFSSLMPLVVLMKEEIFYVSFMAFEDA